MKHLLLKIKFYKYGSIFKCSRQFSTKCEKSPYRSVVGLEIHAQITSCSKLFSGASTEFSKPVNTNVSLFDVAMPGTLPVLNRRCVEAAVLTALALSCKINPVSSFDRKHYFYPDLPSGYQITQHNNPLAVNGCLKFDIVTPDKNKKVCKKASQIKQLQLEQDSGKSLHDEENKRSLVDLNRAGMPLMEIVFEPDLSNGEEAAALVKELVLILKRLETCSCKMEEGALRVDANVSIHKEGEEFGPRTEIKNIGSIKGVATAINFEIERQKKVVSNGEKVRNETRAWDAENKITVAMRDKEEYLDYRFIPEADLPPLYLKVSESQSCIPDLVDVCKLKKCIPELPEETRTNLSIKYGLPIETVIILVNEEELLTKFESIMKTNPKRSSKLVASILIVELLTIVNRDRLDVNCVSDKQIGDLVDMLQNKLINLVIARKVLLEMVMNKSKNAEEIVKKNNWAQIIDDDEITVLCIECLGKNSKLVEEYKKGKTKVLSALLGEVAKLSEQRANMSLVVKKLKQLLKN